MPSPERSQLKIFVPPENEKATMPPPPTEAERDNMRRVVTFEDEVPVSRAQKAPFGVECLVGEDGARNKQQCFLIRHQDGTVTVRLVVPCEATGIIPRDRGLWRREIAKRIPKSHGEEVLLPFPSPEDPTSTPARVESNQIQPDPVEEYCLRFSSEGAPLASHALSKRAQDALVRIDACLKELDRQRTDDAIFDSGVERRPLSPAECGARNLQKRSDAGATE